MSKPQAEAALAELKHEIESATEKLFKLGLVQAAIVPTLKRDPAEKGR